MNGAALFAGVRLGARRVLAPRALVAAVLTLVLATVLALSEKRASAADATNRALFGATFGLLIPIFVFFATAHTLDGKRLEDAVNPLSRWGASRRPLALGLSCAITAVSALLAGAAAALTAWVAHDPFAPPLGADLASVTWIGALTAAAYTALFTFGSTWGARGGGRTILFALDFVFGGGASLGNVILPRAHAENLLGGEPPFLFARALSQGTSAIALFAMTCVLMLAALWRCRP